MSKRYGYYAKVKPFEIGVSFYKKITLDGGWVRIPFKVWRLFNFMLGKR